MEKWDLFTGIREKTDKTINFGDPIPAGHRRLVVHACILDEKDRMLIQKRQDGIFIGPNLWDLSAGGGAQSGDSSTQAASREVKEELGIDISFEGMDPVVTTYNRYNYDDIYVIRHPVKLTDLKLELEEVQEVRWATLEEIETLMDNDEFMGYGKHLIRFLFERFLRRERWEKR